MVMNDILSSLENKKQQLERHLPLSPDLLENLHDWFKIELTFTSNAIEGNTLSRAETALVVEKGITVDGKTIVEHLEAINHAQAFEWVVQHIHTPKNQITLQLLLELHQLILQKINDTQAGRFRTVPVRIAGSSVILPNPSKVPVLMEQFIDWLQTSEDHPVKLAAEAHYRLVSIHPFVDGNGRTARLLMNLLLMQAKFPPAIIRKEDRRSYIASIEKGQLGGSLNDYYALQYSAVDRSLDMYLDSLEEKEQKSSLQQQELLKIGQLAKLTGETTPTLRHWTNEGLLKVAELSKGGYQLYTQDQIDIVKTIRTLQESERLTLAEIRLRLG